MISSRCPGYFLASICPAILKITIKEYIEEPRYARTAFDFVDNTFHRHARDAPATPYQENSLGFTRMLVARRRRKHADDHGKHAIFDDGNSVIMREITNGRHFA